jgi:hypothetical protein
MKEYFSDLLLQWWLATALDVEASVVLDAREAFRSRTPRRWMIRRRIAERKVARRGYFDR